MLMLLLLRFLDGGIVLIRSTLDLTSELADAAPHRHRGRGDRRPHAASPSVSGDHVVPVTPSPPHNAATPRIRQFASSIQPMMLWYNRHRLTGGGGGGDERGIRPAASHARADTSRSFCRTFGGGGDERGNRLAVIHNCAGTSRSLRRSFRRRR